MNNLIQLLPDHIANQIAAGEVVQRPASVVKELMENALDAGAQHVRLIVRDAGKGLIQVVDDGVGMSAVDARTAFLRHATSKLREIDDLFSLRTMGFRGEALASIAAVAQVELRTKPRSEELGVMLQIEDSEIKTQEPCQTAAGTSISVKNLFYNVPARRNFLKSDSIELRHIIDEFQRLALAYPDVFFSLHHNDDRLFHLPPGNLRQRVVGIFGKKINKALIPIKEETDILKIEGFIGKPDQARKTRGEQFFFVNNRFIKSLQLNHAVISAYEDLLPKNHYPFYLIFLEMDPARLDVNVHPTKQEIKFDDERIVYNYLRVTARHALAQHSITPSIDFESEAALNRHLDPSTWGNKQESEESPTTIGQMAKQTSQGHGGGGSSYRPFQSANHQRNLQHWDKLYEGLKQPQALPQEDAEILPSRLSEAQKNALFEETKAEGQPARQLYQLHNSYLISPIKSGFLLIDQRAAHKRILYERYQQQLRLQESPSQKLLFPQTLEFSANDVLLMQEMLPELKAMGIDLEPFGRFSFVLHGLPAEASSQNEQRFVEGLLERYKDDQDPRLDQHERLLRALAAQAAVPKGKSLSAAEMQQIIDELFACEIPFLSPEGRKIFITLEMEELERRFK